MYNVLTLIKETGLHRIVNPSNEVVKLDSFTAIRVDKSDPYRGVYVNVNKSIETYFIPATCRLSQLKIETLITGPPEDFRAQIGLTDDFRFVTVAHWTSHLAGLPKKFEFLVGGPELQISFVAGMLQGLDGIKGIQPETILSMRQKTTSIKIKQGTHVSGWTPISQMFPDSLEVPGADADWAESDPLQVRWAVKANPDSNSSSKLILALEGIPCSQEELNKLKPASKGVISGGACSTFLLWQKEANWFAPSAEHMLNTMPGIHLKDRKRDRTPTDLEIRLYLNYAKELSRRGKYLSGEEWPVFWANPQKHAPQTYVPLGVILEEQNSNPSPNITPTVITPEQRTDQPTTEGKNGI